EFDGFIVSSLSQWDVRQGLPPGERPRQVIAPTIVRDVNTPEGRASDIAAMVFDKDIAPAIVPVLDRRPQKGDRFTIVGYGNTSASASQLDGPVAYKRHGRNVVGQAAGDVIRFVGPQTPGAGSFANDESGAAPGDSGGPLFIDGKAAGVTS